MSDRIAASVYLHWIKTHPPVRFNLATSGIRDVTATELGVRIEDIELTGPSFYGYAPLQERLAAHCGVAAERVMATTGTSMANHLVMAALVAPGDEILLEEPAYEPLLATASALGARVRRLARRRPDFALDPAEAERRIGPKTRLVVVSNPHNPTGAVADEATIARLAAAARRSGARLLVDEVYREAVLDAPPPPAYAVDDEAIVTSSLTKAYGLGGLRCGWVVADAPLVAALWRRNDLYGVIPAHPAERLAVLAFDRLDALRRRSRALLAANHAVLRRFAAARPDLDWPVPTTSTVCFPRWRGGPTDGLVRLLRERYETAVVPGAFFEAPEHVRIGLGGPTEALEAGLARLGDALDEMGGER